MREQLYLPLTSLFFECLDLLNRVFMLISVFNGQMFYFFFFFHVLAHFVLVLQVGVKNIPNHNNHVPFDQLRDLTAH